MQLTPRYHGCHEIQIEKGSFIDGILGEKARVNSYHHQSVKSVAKGFAVTAKTMDGIVEALEREDGTFMVGVQWHPEMMAKFGDESMKKLFARFVNICVGK